MCQAPLFSLLRASGADAADFLQGQLTLDIAQLRPMHWAPSAHCAVQGKVLALFWVLRLDEGFLLACAPSLAATIGERLRRFILRQQVRIRAEPRQLFFTAASGTADGRAITAPATDTLCFSPCAGLQATIAATAAANRLGANAVILALITARIALLDAATQEKFLPQMLDLEEIGALHYDKGCYLGQEAIARAWHKAPVRRHLKRLRAAIPADATTPPAGTTLYHQDRAAAVVLQTARNGKSIEALAVVQDRDSGKPLRDRARVLVFSLS